METSKPAFITAVACGFFALWVVFAVLTSRSLYADGSYYFLRVLQAGSFTEILLPRSYAAYLFQFPVVLLLKLGVTDLHWLAMAFGVGCLCAWPVAMWLCYRLAPERFWLVMLACAAGYLNAAFMAVGEHIVAHAFFWPALFVILYVRPLTPKAAVILLASAVLLTRSYESLLFLGPPLVILIGWRLVREREQTWQRVVLWVAGVLFVAAAVIALDAVRHPLSAANLGGFKRGVFSALLNPPWTVLMCGLFGVVFLLLIVPQVAGLVMRPAGAVILALAVAGWGVWPWLSPASLDPDRQYECRFLDLLVPLLLLPLACLFSIRPGWFARQHRACLRLSAAMLVAQSLWHIAATYQWQGYIRSWQQLLATERGPLLLSNYYHDAKAEGGQALTFDWYWANPTLSIMVGPRQVQALFMPGRRLLWQPFDPLDPRSLPSLERYGIDYTAYTNSLPPRPTAGTQP